MKSKRGLAVVISVVLFLAVLLLGANTVFSVTHIEIAYAISSEQARVDSLKVQKLLEEEYVGGNIFFIKDEKVTAYFNDYPYLTVKSIEKSYPNKLVLSVEEKTEKYAVPVEEDGVTVYYMTDANGEILRKKTSNVNNVDGGENFLIEGLRYSAPAGFSGDDNFAMAIRICAKMEELTGGVRTCLTSMKITSDATGSELVVYTREGVTIYIGNPALFTDKKVEAAIKYYLSLEDKDKLYGYITVLDDINQSGAIVGPTYTPRA